MKRIFSLVLIMALTAIICAGCGAGAKAFSHSDGIDSNGFWKGVKALKKVQLCEYKGIAIPSEVHTVSDESLQAEIDTILADYMNEEQVTDRAVAGGDTVNIDYVGSIDGVAFEGGSTGGPGTKVTIGVTSYIDDFLEQLIGHTPGESFDIEVTFPEDYGVENLNGKDAVFAATVNYIVERTLPDLTDDFVAVNLSLFHGWNTVAEMEEGIRGDLRSAAVTGYVQDYIVANTTVQSVPKSMIAYQEKSLIEYYQGYAEYCGMELDALLNDYMGLASTGELLQEYSETNTQQAAMCLIMQAVAEDAGIAVTHEDVAAYFKEYTGSEDYTQYEETHGMPYIKLMVLHQAILDYLYENAVMA